MSQDWRRTITKYFEELLSGEFPIDAFCSGYETWWNLDLPDGKHLTRKESDALESVFDVVVVYSPFEKELKQIPMYKSEQEVRATVEAALLDLQK